MVVEAISQEDGAVPGSPGAGPDGAFEGFFPVDGASPPEAIPEDAVVVGIRVIGSLIHFLRQSLSRKISLHRRQHKYGSDAL